MLNPREILDFAPWEHVRFGQKQTFALQYVMSALHPKTDMCGAIWDVRFGPKRTFAFLFDHLVGSL